MSVFNYVTLHEKFLFLLEHFDPLHSLCDIRASASVCVWINMHVHRYMHVPGYMGAGLFMFIATVCRFVA